MRDAAGRSETRSGLSALSRAPEPFQAGRCVLPADERPVMGVGGIMQDLSTQREEHIVITDADRERLLPVLDHHDGVLSEPLDSELHRALIVPQRDVPADVVTMNSEVVYEDAATGSRRAIRIVYPKDADATLGLISILAPIGAALLGLRVGQEITWRVPNGTKRLRVLEIRYQPEAAGDFTL